jgi:hypothetical protein
MFLVFSGKVQQEQCCLECFLLTIRTYKTRWCASQKRRKKEKKKHVSVILIEEAKT